MPGLLTEQLCAWFEGEDPDVATEQLASWLDSTDDDPEDVAAQFWDAVGANLREGKIRLAFVADEIPATLQRLVEFLNEQMPRVEVLAVEIRQYRAAGSRSGALVSRVVGQTSRAQAVKQRPVPAERRPARWSVDEVLEQIAQAGEDEAAAASVVRGWAERHPYIQLTGGTGVSYPSISMSADSGRDRSRYRGVLALYASPQGESPMLEIRVKRMCRTRFMRRPGRSGRAARRTAARPVILVMGGGVAVWVWCLRAGARPGGPRTATAGLNGPRLPSAPGQPATGS